MASSLVAGRVDEDVKKRADFVIRRKGITQAQVIRFIWSEIAETGEVPGMASAQKAKGSLQERLRTLREATPRSEHLENLTPEMLKKELESRG